MRAPNLSIHPYTDQWLPSLQAAVATWISQSGRCGYDHIGELPHRIYENLRGRHEIGDAVAVWLNGEEIAGVAITMRFGNAFDVLCAPDLRGTDAESEMLHWAYRNTVRLGGTTTDPDPYILTDTFDCDAERARLLTNLGFEHFRTWDDVNERDLALPVEPVQPAAGFEIRSARFEDADELAEVRNHSFDEEWTGALYRSHVMEKPGYRPDHEIVATTADGRIAAFAVYWTDSLNKHGHFEPVGTHSDFQRKGLARAVMTTALQRMQDDGMLLVTVNHDAENIAAHRLYAALGFVKRHETHGYRRLRAHADTA